jgi:hypothetical protein
MILLIKSRREKRHFSLLPEDLPVSNDAMMMLLLAHAECLFDSIIFSHRTHRAPTHLSAWNVVFSPSIQITKNSQERGRLWILHIHKVKVTQHQILVS